MSHTKQTPVLQYATADLPPSPLSGTVVYNTDENCLNYYNGSEWESSGNWDSTYTTVSANSAVWSAGGASAVIWEPLIEAGSIQESAAMVPKFPTGYPGAPIGYPMEERGAGAVDLQLSIANAGLSDHVAGGRSSGLFAGTNNKIAPITAQVNLSLNENSGIFCGSNNTIETAGKNSVIIGGDSNTIQKILPNSNSSIGQYSVILAGRLGTINHDYTVLFNGGTDAFNTEDPYTFNIRAIGNSVMQANNIGGLRYVYDGIDHTGDVLTCMTNEGYSSWTTLSADEWNSVYTTVQTESASWADHADLTDVIAASGDWNSTYTTVQDNSATWDAQADLTDIIAASGDWNSTYTTVQDNSATWDDQADLTDVIAASGDWNSTYTTVQTESADWESTYTTVQTESAGWDSHADLADVIATSGNWNSTYTTVQTESAGWDSHADLTDVIAASGDWDSTYTTVQGNSAKWESVYTSVTAKSAAWNSASEAIAYNIGSTNSLELGALDGTTETGNSAISIQTGRGSNLNVAQGSTSIAIGSDTKTGSLASDSMAIGSGAKTDAPGSMVIGYFAEGVTSTPSFGCAIGYATRIRSYSDVAIGSECVTTNLSNQTGALNRSVAMGYKCSVIGGAVAIGKYCIAGPAGASTTNGASVAMGFRVRNRTGSSSGTDNSIHRAAAEFGWWSSDNNQERQAGVKCFAGGGRPSSIANNSGVAITTLSASSPWAAGGTATHGEEANTTLPYKMHVVRAWRGKFYLDSNDWSNTVTTIPLDSTLGDNVHSHVQTTSADWESTYTTVQAESAGWDSHADLTDIIATSGNWNSTYTTVQAESAGWADHFDATEVQAASGDWNSTYTTVQAESAGWDSHADLTDVIAASANWDSTYTTVQTESADWDDTRTTVQTNSADSVFKVDTVTTSSYTQVAGTSHFLYDDTTAGAILSATLLPPASHRGETTHTKIGNTHNVTLSSNTAATINGAQSYTLTTQYETVKLFTDGANYYVY